MAQARSPEEISAEIAQTRNRLAGTVDQLVYRVKPKTIAKRRSRASGRGSWAPTEGSRADAIAKIAGVVVGVVAAIVVIRKIVG